MSDKHQDRRKTPAGAADLRKRAEEQAGAAEPVSLSAQTPEAIEQLIHELRVHQIELELQNEELRTAQAELEASQAYHFEFYNLAPVGYATVSEKGVILEANLTAATLLGVNRGTLVKQPLTRFIYKQDQDIYYLHRKKIFDTGAPQRFELRLVKPDGSAFWTYLEATFAEGSYGEPVCRVVLSDISERKQAEESLLQEKREKELIVNNLSEQVAFLDLEMNILW
jgi:PAS domain S-box-containing protein